MQSNKAMQQPPTIQRIAELQQLIATFAGVERVYYLPNMSRKDADTDHSFGLALTCWYLQPKIAPELDLLEIFKLALAHDLVEIHAGDTFVFDNEGLQNKDNRERAAITQLRSDWPDFVDMADYAEKYMNKSSEEAKFVKAVDKLLPVLLLDLSGEKEWKRLAVTLEMEQKNKVSIRVSAYVSPYYEKLLAWLDERGNIPKH